MNWSVLRNEWGAVTFVLTVVAGMIIVPLAFYFGNQTPPAVVIPTATPTVVATSPRTATPSPTTSPSPSPSPSPSR